MMADLKMETKEMVQIFQAHSYTHLYNVSAFAHTQTHIHNIRNLGTQPSKRQSYIHTVLSKIHSELENVVFSLSTSEFAISTSIPFIDILRLQNMFPSFCDPI